MKNLKRVLALVLAVAMCMTFGITAGAKDFTDNADINYNEAVGLLSDIEVINGYTDGSFGPSGDVTRAEMAKMIYVIMNGEDDGAKNFASVTKFSDVPTGNWAAGYVAYCVSEGVIAGMGDGTFKPATNVTGAQAAKMMLACMGYEADKEGFTGAQWALNVTNKANQEKLFDGMSGFNAENTLSREEAAQMMKNMLLTKMRAYDNNNTWTVTTGDTTISQKSDAIYMKDDKGNKTNDSDQAITVLDYYFDDVSVETDTNDNFGRPATLVKVQGEDDAYYADAPDTTVVGKPTKKALYNAVGKSVYNSLTKSKDAATLNIWVNGNHVKEDISGDDVKDIMDKDSSANTLLAPKGSACEVFIDDDDNVTITFISYFLLQADGDYNSSKEELKVTMLSEEFPSGDAYTLASDSKTLELDDFAISGYEDEDYIVATAYSNDGKTGLTIDTIMPATVITGVVESYTKDAQPDADVTIDGTTYEYQGTFNTDDGNYNPNGDLFTIGDETTVITAGTPLLLGIDDLTVSTGKYVYVKELYKDGNSSSAATKADAYFTDGTNSTITVEKLWDGDEMVKTKSIDKDDLGNYDGKWYTYSEGTDSYKLNKVESKYLSGNKAAAVVAAGKDVVKNGKTTADAFTDKMSNATVFVVLDDDDEVTVYTGISKVPTVTSGGKTEVAYLVDGTKVGYVFVDASDDDNVKIDDKSASADDYVFILKTKYVSKQDKNDNTYYEYDALIDGEVTKIKATDDASIFDAAGLYNKIKVNSDGYVTDANAIDATDGANGYGTFNWDGTTDGTTTEVAFTDGALTLGDFKDDLILNSDSVVYLIKAGTMVDDEDNTYEVDTVSGKTLKSTMNDHAGNGFFVGVFTDDYGTDSYTAETLYVYATAK